MQINRKTRISISSKGLLLLAKFFLPDVSKLVLPKGAYVDNDEMYSLQQDRIDANPAAFHPDKLSRRENTKRNILISLIRRHIWEKACRVGIVISIVGTIFWGGVNYITEQALSGVSHIQESNRAEDIKEASKQMTIDNIKNQVAQLKSDCEAGRKDAQACQAEMSVLKQQYQQLSK